MKQQGQVAKKTQTEQSINTIKLGGTKNIQPGNYRWPARRYQWDVMLHSVFEPQHILIDAGDVDYKYNMSGLYCKYVMHLIE